MRFRGLARVKLSRFHWVGEGSQLRSRVQRDTGKTGSLLDASGGAKLRGALKDAPRVIPRRYRELDLEVELHDSIYRRR